jgi:hypothetical protein
VSRRFNPQPTPSPAEAIPNPLGGTLASMFQSAADAVAG